MGAQTYRCSADCLSPIYLLAIVRTPTGVLTAIPLIGNVVVVSYSPERRVTGSRAASRRWMRREMIHRAVRQASSEPLCDVGEPSTKPQGTCRKPPPGSDTSAQSGKPLATHRVLGLSQRTDMHGGRVECRASAEVEECQEGGQVCMGHRRVVRARAVLMPVYSSF